MSPGGDKRLSPLWDSRACLALDFIGSVVLLDHSTKPMPTPQPTPLPDTRARIVEAARALFWEKGYAATGLAEILARARANSGSFYHFFESKDALLCTVLDTYVELLEPQVIGPVWASTRDPLDRVFALLAGYRKRLVDTSCQGPDVRSAASRSKSTLKTRQPTRTSRATFRRGKPRLKHACAPRARLGRSSRRR